MQDGVIYVATGAGYLDLARASALSVRAHNPDLPVDLYTDIPEAPDLTMFDRVHPVPRVHIRAKLDCLPLSRFARTLYLDCDTLALQGFGDLFDLLERFELALAHDVRRASELIRQGAEETTPYAFPQLNSGVVLYRKSAQTQAFFAEWARRYHAAGQARDQVTLKDLLWASDIRFYVLPPEFNLRRVTVLDAWEPLDARPTILHSHRLLQHLRDSGAGRVTDLAQLLRLERAALAEEWARAGSAPDARDRTDALPQAFSTAQARQTDGSGRD